MPKNKKQLPFLVAIVFLVLACGGTSNSGSTNPITPTTSPVVATQTLPGKTEMPTVGPTTATASPAATGIETLQAANTATATISSTATIEKITFSPLKVTIVSSLDKATMNFDDSGWPNVVVMPAHDYIYFAVKCEGKVNQGIFQIPKGTGDVPIVNSACPGRAELLLIYPMEAGSIILSGYGEILARLDTGQDGLSIIRRIYQNPAGSQLVVWLQKP